MREENSYDFYAIINMGFKSTWRVVNNMDKEFMLTLREVDNDLIVTKHKQKYCHDANIETLNQQIVNTSSKRKALEEMAKRLRKLFVVYYRKICF